mmetsp:Transcript_16856/g.63960  ORF Transcript_16856/g.63960 Transcript_16856/m.63960 type:complete len:244 (-) Transcript_16856:862-1593(-)
MGQGRCPPAGAPGDRWQSRHGLGCGSHPPLRGEWLQPRQQLQRRPRLLPCRAPCQVRLPLHAAAASAGGRTCVAAAGAGTCAAAGTLAAAAGTVRVAGRRGEGAHAAAALQCAMVVLSDPGDPPRAPLPLRIPHPGQRRRAAKPPSPEGRSSLHASRRWEGRQSLLRLHFRFLQSPKSAAQKESEWARPGRLRLSARPSLAMPSDPPVMPALRRRGRMRWWRPPRRRPLVAPHRKLHRGLTGG